MAAQNDGKSIDRAELSDIYLDLDLVSMPDFTQSENHTVFYYGSSFQGNVATPYTGKYNSPDDIKNHSISLNGESTPTISTPRAGGGRKNVMVNIPIYYDHSSNTYKGTLRLWSIDYKKTANGSYYDWVAISPETIRTTPGKAYDRTKHAFIDLFRGANFAVYNTYKIHSESISNINAISVKTLSGRRSNRIYISPIADFTSK